METPLSHAEDRQARETDVDDEAVMDALGDADCRAILAAVADRARSATAVASTCDLPLSTTYRKLNRLEALGLVTERTRVDPAHNHHNVYHAPPVELTVSLSQDGALSVAPGGQ